MKPIETLQAITVQVATPTSVGLGIALSSYRVIITNEHLVRGYAEAVVGNRKKELVSIRFIDAAYDLALLDFPENWATPPVTIEIPEDTAIEQPVFFAGLSEGVNLNILETIITDLTILQDKRTYLELDLPISSENSGSPLVNEKGVILGFNSAYFSINDTFGFSLSSKYLLETLELYKKENPSQAVRCEDCRTIVNAKTRKKGCCPSCFTPIELPSDSEPYRPQGVGQSIEALLEKAGYNVPLTRKGPNAWEVQRGSATIQIAYNEQEGYIIGDAFLCRLPDLPSEELYQFLLRQNYEVKGLNFSIKEGDVVLSLLIYERDLNLDTGVQLVNNLLEQADFYDNILVEKYGAKW